MPRRSRHHHMRPAFLVSVATLGLVTMWLMGFLFIPRFIPKTDAALQSLLVFMTDTSPSTSTAMTFRFKPNVSVPPGGRFRLALDAAFTQPGTATTTDASVSIDGVSQTLSPTQNATDFGYTKDASFYYVTVSSGTSIGAASSVQITIGHNGGLLTPGTPGIYAVSANVFNTSSQGIENGASLVSIQLPVGFSASVSSSDPLVFVKWATPENRVGAPETNDDNTYYLTIRTSDNTDNAILFTQPTLATTTEAGISSSTTTLTGITSGIYDVGFKSGQHLTKVLQDVTILGSTTTQLNFTNDTNTTTKGTLRLKAGDINGAGTTPATLGDDVVNSVDLSLMVDRLDENDPSGNVIRANLNQDVVVNSVDLSMLINHLDEQGER